MTWSEKAIEAAYDAWEASRWKHSGVTIDERVFMRAVLDAAAAVDGDAHWNAACDEITKNLRELSKLCRAHDEFKRAYNSGVDDALSLVDSMRRG